MATRLDSFYVGHWRVDPQRNVIVGPDGETRVRPRTMAVLVRLADQAGQVVQKRALMDAVWGSVVVSEDVLTQAIVELRRAFDDAARNPVIIETTYRVGYRLIPDVYDVRPTRVALIGWVTAAALAAVAVFSGLGVWLMQVGDFEPPLRADGPSVAVLPFENLSPDAEDEYFAAGIHEELLNQLAKLNSLRVIARTSVLRYADERPSIQQIANELNVETVMEGSIRYADNRVRITAQLIDPNTGSHLWSDTYERAFEDIFSIESDIAISIAKALEAEFSAAEQESIETMPTNSPAAYALFLQFLVEPDEDAVEFLDRAISIDPDFALAHAAKAYWYASGTTDATGHEETIRNSAERALKLDPTLGLAHAALGDVHRSHWRWSEAREAFERALELSPNDPTVLTAAGRLSRRIGEYAEGVRLGRRAVELDPYNGIFHYQLGITLRFARNYEAAFAVLRKAIDLNPARAGNRMQLAFTAISRGNYEEAASELQIAEQLLVPTGLNAFRITQFALGYAQLGRREDVDRLRNELEHVEQESPVDDAVWAMAYIASGDYEQALSRLETAIKERSPRSILALGAIKANAYQIPVLDEDPRFVSVRNGIGTD